MLKKLRMKKEGFTLVELMIVVAIIGILAAIAIPAFLKYIKSSKAAEATGIMKKMADGSKSYFTSEQKSCGGLDGCDQPWHTAGTTGYPVKWASYVFPGGTSFTYSSTSDAPTGGSKYLPDPIDSSNAAEVAATNKLNFGVEDPLYFQYIYETGDGSGEEAEADITAIADFKVNGNSHTVTQKVSVNETSQEVMVGPSVVTYEFE